MARLTILIFALCFSFGNSFKGDDPIKLLSMKAVEDGQGNLRFSVALEIPKPWHIYSDTVAQPYYTAAGLIPADTAQSVQSKKFPKSQDLVVLGDTVQVFEGLVDFESVVPAGKKETKVVLKYQACSDKLCLPPVRKKYKASLSGSGALKVTPNPL